MIRNPRPPESLGDLLRWAKEVSDYLASKEDSESPGSLLVRTTRGTTRTPMVEPGGVGESTSPQPRGRWDPTIDYIRHDIVHVDSVTLNPVVYEGLFICLEDIAGDADNLEPGSDPTHWELYVPRWQTAFSVGPPGPEPKVDIYMQADASTNAKIILDGPNIGLVQGLSSIQLDTGKFLAFQGSGLTNFHIEPRLVTWSNDGGVNFQQAIFLCTEPQAI